MITGHLATVLIPLEKETKAPIWLLLFSTLFLDFLWLGLVVLGIEKLEPAFFLDSSFQNIKADVPYSHDLLPNILLAVIVYFLVKIVWKQKKLAVWCALLVFMHFLCDLFVGFEHYIFKSDSTAIGMNLYGNSPHLAIVIEALFCAAIIGWYIEKRRARGAALTTGQITGLYVFFCGGILIWLPTATIPLRQLLGL